MKLIILAAFFVGSLAAEIGFRHYDGYQVLTVESTNDAQALVIKALYDSDDYDFWSSPKKLGSTDIMAAPEQMSALKNLLDKNGMSYQVKVQDVQSLIEEDREANKRGGTGRMDWTSYPRYSEIEAWLNSINSSIATLSGIGKSFEGRNIYAVKFSSGGPPKKSVFIDANIHAREWISGATATWIINELISNSTKYASILQELDIHIVPMINVDGYEWSQARDRMWRKTRSTQNNTLCIGCDPNRNWAFKFGGEGTSSNPCSDTYHGLGAFSEPETQAVRDYILGQEANNATFHAYMTFHSYGQFWLLPWGYTAGVYPPDYAEQLSLGRAAIGALRAVSGTVYATGQGADLLYGVGGASDDWAKDHGIKYTATIEMRDEGRYGFVLPPAQIIPNAQEVWAGLQEVFKRVMETP